MYCAFCMPPFFSMPCLFICTSEYRIVCAMSFPSTWKWFWKCQSCLLYSVITCLLFDFIISSASGKILGEAKHLSEACQQMIWSGKKYPNESAICHMYKTDDCSLLKGLPSVCVASFKTRALHRVKTCHSRYGCRRWRFFGTANKNLWDWKFVILMNSVFPNYSLKKNIRKRHLKYG